jgi:hypothetical protein
MTYELQARMQAKMQVKIREKAKNHLISEKPLPESTIVRLANQDVIYEVWGPSMNCID